MRPLLLLVLAALLAAPVAAQVEPGWGFTWEPVGDKPIDADALTVDAEGVLWAACPDSLRHLDFSAGAPGRWRGVPFGDTGSGLALLGLGADTLLQTGGGIIRSVNGGQFFFPAWNQGSYALYEIPAGHPYARRVLAGGRSGGAEVGYSDARGAAWTASTFSTGTTEYGLYDLTALPPSTVPATPGRLLGAGIRGFYLSDDGGASWRAATVFNAAYNGRFVRALERPASEGGGVRAVAMLNASGASAVRTYTSEDGGETWGRGVDLVEPAGTGLGWPSVQGVVGLGGPSAVAVLGRGRVHRTDDGGATWTEIAQTPRLTATTIVSMAVLGADGRLYVSMEATGTARAWVYRTAEVLAPTSAGEAGPESEVGIRVSVVPNPSGGTASVRLTLGAAGPVTVAVYDGLGREVAVLHDGALTAGAHALALDASALAAGAYVVRVVARPEGGGARVAVRRLTVAR